MFLLVGVSKGLINAAVVTQQTNEALSLQATWQATHLPACVGVILWPYKQLMTDNSHACQHVFQGIAGFDQETE